MTKTFVGLETLRAARRVGRRRAGLSQKDAKALPDVLSLRPSSRNLLDKDCGASPQ
ncbi:MAG: hypothetical protein FWE10_01205 [Rikenellaceae bacterium]|nr:hypothetical protein [Rikenellaceae bacterium]MCL2692648.1 hypothetical protein [Rikenellaceae bacterium]